MHCPQTALLASPFAQLSRDDSDTKMDQSLSPRPLAVVLEPAARSAPSFTLTELTKGSALSQLEEKPCLR